MSKHTPGPWFASGPCVYKGLETDMPAPMLVEPASPRETLFSDGESEANARLIAAAPDMFAMLEAIESQGAIQFVTARMGSLRSLIRKVRGQK